MLNSPTVVALILAIPLGAIVALFAGYYIGSTRNKAYFEKSLRAQKEASEQRLLEAHEQQHRTLRDAHNETAHLRTTMERENAERRSELQRQEHRLQQLRRCHPILRRVVPKARNQSRIVVVR